MTWWIVGGAAFVLLQVVFRRPTVKAWVRNLSIKRRCPACGASIRVDVAICPICHTTCAPMAVETGRAELKQLQRAHEDYVDAYVAKAGGRPALQTLILERAKAAGADWTDEGADAVIDAWRVQWLKPVGFEQMLDRLVRDTTRVPWLALVLPEAFASVFAWAGIALACSRLGLGPFVDTGEGSFKVVAHGTSGRLELAGSWVGAALVALPVVWLLFKAHRKGWLTFGDD
jgi:hypothetical protein